MGRDVRPDQLPAMVDTFNNWHKSCEAMLADVARHIAHLDQEKEAQLAGRAEFAKKLEAAKQTAGERSRGSMMDVDGHGMDISDSTMADQDLRRHQKSSRLHRRPDRRGM